MARIERATSPLPRECSTTEPHGLLNFGIRTGLATSGARRGNQACADTLDTRASTGAGDGNRTRVISLEGWSSTIELLPPGSQTTPTLAHSAEARDTAKPPRKNTFRLGGGGWIRTSVLVRGQIYSLLPLTTRPPLRGEPQTISRSRKGSANRPPIHHFLRRDEVAAVRHELPLDVVRRVARPQRADAGPRRYGPVKERLRFASP